MKERPILFSGPMVRAILEGRKTQTQRVIKRVEGDSWRVGDGFYPLPTCDRIRESHWTRPGSALEMCPYGQPGARLWVRETWRVHQHHDALSPRLVQVAMGGDTLGCVDYQATPRSEKWWGHWRPSIFMPRWASRITLEITHLRVQRVQEISEEDADAEGFGGYIPPDVFPAHDGSSEWYDGGKSIVGCFAELWDSLNTKRGYSWESNPWVWALTFQVV